MVCQRQRQEPNKSLYVQKNFKSSIIRLGYTSTEWSRANANTSDQEEARGRRQNPNPHEITGLSHSAKFLWHRDFEGQISLFQTEQSLWWKQRLLVASVWTDTTTKSGLWPGEAGYNRDQKNLCVCACTWVCMCTHIYIYVRWELGYIWFFKSVLKAICHWELSGCCQPSGQGALCGLKGQTHRPMSPYLGLADTTATQ